MVVNARHIRNVPGRKTDVKDAEWISNLLQHGQLQGGFIPSREQRELRELVRYRRSLIEERSREFNRIQKVLEGAIIKLSSVVSDVLGKSSRSMIERSLPAKPTRSPLRVGPSKNETEKMNDKHALHGLIGPNYYEECMRTHVTKQAIRKLEFLGYKATIEAMNQTA